jgi:AraC-like DNA-binding protein
LVFVRTASDFPQSVSETFAATREQIVIPSGKSYLIRRDDYPNPICIWNYHPEWEIHYIPEAHGYAYVGDYIGPFSAGHLVLSGTNLPHNWVTPGTPTLPGRDLVLQFDAEALISISATCPEFDVLRRINSLARRGIEILGKQAQQIGEMIIKLHEQNSGLGLFIDILNAIEQAPNKRLLASEGFIAAYNQISDKRFRRIDTAIQLLQSNPSMQMHEVAQAVGLEVSAFSRAFRRLTGMNFSVYIRTLRVWRARTLLAQGDAAITDICFESGFSNLSNFNRYFRIETGLTPREYRSAAQIRRKDET